MYSCIIILLFKIFELLLNYSISWLFFLLPLFSFVLMLAIYVFILWPFSCCFVDSFRLVVLKTHFDVWKF